jgi:hypothetical protein
MRIWCGGSEGISRRGPRTPAAGSADDYRGRGLGGCRGSPNPKRLAPVADLAGPACRPVTEDAAAARSRPASPACRRQRRLAVAQRRRRLLDRATQLLAQVVPGPCLVDPGHPAHRLPLRLRVHARLLPAISKGAASPAIWAKNPLRHPCGRWAGAGRRLRGCCPAFGRGFFASCRCQRKRRRRAARALCDKA